MTPSEIDELERLAKAATPGYWSLPHFADDVYQNEEPRPDPILGGHGGPPCKCGYVLCERYMGSVAEVSRPEDEKNEGDHPPIEEAKANARWIHATQPRNILALIARLRALEKVAKAAKAKEALSAEWVQASDDEAKFNAACAADDALKAALAALDNPRGAT